MLTTILILSTTFGFCQRAFLASNHWRLAGDAAPILYQLSADVSTARLTVFHNLGAFTARSEVKNCVSTFNLPQPLLNQSGTLTFLLQDSLNRTLQRDIMEILPDTTEIPTVEAYSGPKQILTGGADYTAAIGTALDTLDNPWPMGTPVQFNYFYKNNRKTAVRPSGKLCAYHRFFSDREAGYPVISVTAAGASHQQFELTLYPNDPDKFLLQAMRDHPFADGKQVTEISTSVITDNFGNLIADGTIVRFQIQDDQGRITMANARTVNGQALLRLPAPSRPTTWQVTAQIDEYKAGEPIRVNYLSAVQPYSLWQVSNYQLAAGPILSFLDQWVADNLPVSLTIYMDEVLVAETKAYLENGIVEFDLATLNLDACEYLAVSDCGGQKTYQPIRIE